MGAHVVTHQTSAFNKVREIWDGVLQCAHQCQL